MSTRIHRMSKDHRGIGILLVLGILGFTWGCEGCGCSRADILAELEEITGAIDRDFAPQQNQWQSAAQGDEFRLGDGVRAGNDSKAVLKLSGNAYALLKENSLIRFMDSMPEQNSLGMDIQTGEAEIIVGSSEMRLLTSVGLAILQSNSRVRITKEADGLDFRVTIGTATIETNGNQRRVVRKGDRLQIGIGSAIIDPTESPDSISEKGATAADASPQEQVKPENSVDLGIDVNVVGNGVLIMALGERSWSSLSAGASKIGASAALRLPKNTSVSLDRNGEKATIQGTGEFTMGPTGGHLVESTLGKIIFETSNKDITIIVPGGKIVALADKRDGSKASVNVKKNQTLLNTVRGGLRLDTANHTTMLQQGDKAILSSSGAVQMPQGAVQINGGIDDSDLSVPVGESFIIHTTKPPVAVHFKFAGKCPGGGIIQLARTPSFGASGDDSVSIMVPRGRSKYQLRCLDENKRPLNTIAAWGNMVIIRDSGTTQLPQKAPASRVDADGRKYKIMYQNQLPIVRFVWAKAPKAGSYSLRIAPQSQASQTLTTMKPEHTFSSGDLKDGIYNLTFLTRGGYEHTSKTTTVQISFDNVAPKASIKTPRENSFGLGESVAIAGVAAPGWSVSLPNGTISMDEQHRFFGEVIYTKKQRAIALRLVHPRRGVHYYLRRGRTGE